MIEASVSRRDTDRVIRSFSELPLQIIRAKRRAIKRETQRIATLTRRELAAQNNIPQKGLRARKRIITPVAFSDLGIVWVGYNDLAIVYAGRPQPRQIKGNGIIFRGVHYPHAFKATMPTGHRGFFQRTGRMTNPRAGEPKRQIEEIKIPLEHVSEVIQAVRIESGVRLQDRFAQELNFELNRTGISV